MNRQSGLPDSVFFVAILASLTIGQALVFEATKVGHAYALFLLVVVVASCAALFVTYAVRSWRAAHPRPRLNDQRRYEYLRH